MIVSLLGIIGGFIWLGVETKWLTLHLVVGKEYKMPLDDCLNLLSLLFSMVFLLEAIRNFTIINYKGSSSRQRWYLRYRLIRLLKIGIAVKAVK